MAIRPLRYAPDPILMQKTRRVKEIDASLLSLIDDMIETMQAAHGVGLAANQVGVPLRLAVIQLLEDEEATVLINPEIIRCEGEREVEEGCLSIPEYRGLVKRSVKVRVKALDRDGKSIRIRAEDDLLAQALEHETGHLDGTLYVQYLVSRDKLWKVTEEADAEEDGGEPSPAQVTSSGQ